MKIQRDITQVFGFLSRRIVEFEVISDPPTKAYKFEDIIYDIFLCIDKYSAEEVQYHATLIYERIQPLLERDYNEEVRIELEYYSESLYTIIQPRKALLNQVKPGDQISSIHAQVIELPESFTVKQLTKHFEPSLTPSQAALLLYYFKDKGILPPYSDASLGKLAEHFFARNQKNLTTNLTNIHTLKASKNELESLKKVLSSLIEEIDDDIKKAR
jgi:hypothetical protein